MKIKDTFGLKRVVEPRASVPATAWKIDNKREIYENEARVSLRVIHLERDSFQQICSSSGFDESKIKAKIIDIVKKRGKLHNPYTDSGGIFYGVIEEMGEEYSEKTSFKVGDEIFSQTSLAAIPIHIEKIIDIDYNYGEIEVEGYGILFSSSPISHIVKDLNINYTMATLDEAGSLYNIYSMVEPGMRVLILGKDLVSTIIYISTVKKAVGKDCHITVVLDEDSIGSLSKEKIREILASWSNETYIVDVTKPIVVFESLELEEVDLTINCEDLKGAEVFSVLMTKNKGKLYFASIQNSYIEAILVAESMGKEIETYALDQYSEGYENFTAEMIWGVKEELTKINNLYESQKVNYGTAKKKALDITDKKIGKLGDYIYSSPVTESLVDETLNIADFDCNVIIQGETGVGKEKILSIIHNNSTRNAMPCVKINCATIQENLAESEFFGYEPGAFTGAQSSGKKGYFEIANGGILFLDEVGTLSLQLQSKLLRVLQENQFYKVGGTKPIDINVRIICANNIPLRQLVEEGKFREDLYYRLNICTLTVPPLRDRREDIDSLAKSFIKRFSERYGKDKTLDSSALIKLAGHNWPGNVRELENLIHRVYIATKNHIIYDMDIENILNESVYEDIVLDIRSSMKSSAELDFNQIVEQQEQRLIEYALKKCGTTRKAAEYLNMSQPQLMRKKQKYEI